jgi:hypothetical protein
MFVTVVAVLCHLGGPAAGSCVEEIVTDSSMTPDITFYECMKWAQAPLSALSRMGVLAICPRTIAQIERVIRPTFISLATYGRCFRLAVAAAQRVAAKRWRTAPRRFRPLGRLESRQ